MGELFATGALAGRIERGESSLIRAIAVAASERASVFIESVGGGVATFLRAGSPVNKLAGLGFAEGPSEDELATIEQAYAGFGASLRVELATLSERRSAAC